MITGLPPSITDAAELEVPKSIPIILAMLNLLVYEDNTRAILRYLAHTDAIPISVGAF
jgi:hypothetical protein